IESLKDTNGGPPGSMRRRTMSGCMWRAACAVSQSCRPGRKVVGSKDIQEAVSIWVCFLARIRKKWEIMSLKRSPMRLILQEMRHSCSTLEIGMKWNSFLHLGWNEISLIDGVHAHRPNGC